MKTTYTYTVLRYLHDPSTGEFVNVGVALYAPELRYAGASCRTTYERFSDLFHGFDGDAFRAVTRLVNSHFLKCRQRLEDFPLLERPTSVMELAHAVLPPDDSSFRWSEPAGGITDDPAAALQKIYARMVSRYDEPAEKGGRTDADVRVKLGQELQQRQVTRYLHPKKIVAPHADAEFPFAYQNGLWNCCEGISFDLQAEGIKKKARQWLGLTVALNKAPERFELALLVAAPPQPDASQRKAFHQALDLLGEDIPVPHQIVPEAEVRRFADEFAERVRQHERERPSAPEAATGSR